jgi:hypothetical protein
MTTALAPSHRQCRPFFVDFAAAPSLAGDCSVRHTDVTQKRRRCRRRSLLMIACSQDNFLAESLDLQKYRYIWYCMSLG